MRTWSDAGQVARAAWRGRAARLALLTGLLCAAAAPPEAAAGPPEAAAAPPEAVAEPPEAAAAPGPVRGPATAIAVRLDAHEGHVQGTVAVTFTNLTPAPLERAYVWLLPNRLGRPPAALDDVNHYWIYPRRFNPGSMELLAVRAGPAPGRERSAPAWQAEAHAVAGRDVLWSVTLPEPVAPGARVHLVMEYRARIPARYGSPGCIRGQCTLLGGFYPMLAALDASGWELGGPPMRTQLDVRVELARPGAVVLLGRAFGVEGEGGRVRRARAQSPDAPYASLVVAPRLHLSTRQVQATTLRYLSPEPPPPTDEAHDMILPYTQENHARFALDTASEALELVRLARAPLEADEITLVEVPLRFELASAHPGMIAVSDRFYRIWPAQRFRKFHQRQLVRALLAKLAARTIVRRGSEHDRDVALAADAVASYLTDLFVMRQYSTNEFMGDILQPVAFIPVVDQLLYAPQTMFAGAYFGGVLDDEPLRDHPLRFMHELPQGRLFYEKLRDLLQPEALRAAMRAMIMEGASLVDAAEAAYGAPLSWFFRQWSRPYPRVNYRLAGWTSRRLEHGSYEHTILVRRQTAPLDDPPVEPVTVAVALAGGERTTLRWDGRGEEGVLTLRSPARIARVIVDPDGRLVEQRLPGQSAHPRFDNRSTHRLRFVYNSFGVLLNVTDLSALLAADFSLSRVHDVANRARFSVFTSAAVTAGVTGRFTRSFGPSITPDRLLGSGSLRLSAQRLRSGFFGDDDERAASRVSLGLGLGASDRLFELGPRFSRQLGVGASVTLTRRDALTAGPDAIPADYLVSSAVSANIGRVHTVAGSHTLAFEADAAAVLGRIASRSQLIAAGGNDGLRGYAPGELFGRARLMLRGEYRHMFRHDLSWNIGHFNILRGVGGALFADVGALSPCESYDLASARSLHASAGYGLSLHYDSFGTLPQLMRIDVAVRLVERDRDCLGAPTAQFPPVMVYLGFLPPF